MIVGIRVTSQNIQTGKIKHTNSSYFTMVAKNEKGDNVKATSLNTLKYGRSQTFYEGVKRIEQRKNMYVHETTFDYSTAEALENLKNTI